MSTYTCPHGCGKVWVGSSNRTAAEPLDADAVAAANAASAANCDRLKTADGSSRALTMSDDDYPCRRLWMDSYLAELDKKHDPVDPGPGGGTDDPVQPCDKANLAVQVKDFDGNPVAGVTVTVDWLGTLTTDSSGIADFGEVPPGYYNATGEKADHRPEPGAQEGPATGGAEAPVCTTTLITLTLDPMFIIKKHNIVFIGSEMKYDSFWWKMMFVGAAYFGIRSLRAADKKTLAYVNNDYSRAERLTLDYLQQNDGFQIVRLASSADLLGLLNNRHESPEGGRTIRYLLQDVMFFSHGVPGWISLDYHGDGDVDLSTENFGSVAADAFLPSGAIYSYACRTGVSKPWENFDSDSEAGMDTSLAQLMANHFRVEVHAFLTRSFYRGVLRDPPDSDRIATVMKTGRAGHEGAVVDIPPEHEGLPHPGLADSRGPRAEGTSEYSLWRKTGGLALPVSHSTPTGLTPGIHVFRPQ